MHCPIPVSILTPSLPVCFPPYFYFVPPYLSLLPSLPSPSLPSSLYLFLLCFSVSLLSSPLSPLLLSSPFSSLSPYPSYSFLLSPCLFNLSYPPVKFLEELSIRVNCKQDVSSIHPAAQCIRIQKKTKREIGKELE
jgi:hypothetical protein